LTERQCCHNYTVSQKKVPTSKLCVILSNLNGSSKFLHYWKAYEIFYTNPYDITHLPTTRHVATLPGEIKNSNFMHVFSKYMEENANKVTDRLKVATFLRHSVLNQYD